MISLIPESKAKPAPVKHKEDWRPSHERNLKHALNPQIGDYWNECFAPVCVVVDVSEFAVTVVDGTKVVDNRKWTFDIEKTTTYTRKEFVDRFRYGRIGNDNFKATDADDIKNKFWCDVFPKQHKWVRELVLEAQNA